MRVSSVISLPADLFVQKVITFCKESNFEQFFWFTSVHMYLVDNKCEEWSITVESQEGKVAGGPSVFFGTEFCREQEIPEKELSGYSVVTCPMQSFILNGVCRNSYQFALFGRHKPRKLQI